MNDRDVGAFDRRAARYESGSLGRMHQRISEHVADVVLATAPHARAVLDIGCGTGSLLRLLAARLPEAGALAGIDPARGMREAAAAVTLDPRIGVGDGTAERLPFAGDSFDVVVAVTSFDHWSSQSRGLAECVRVLRPNAPLVLCDLFSPVLLPTRRFGHRERARTVHSAADALRAAGFLSLRWRPSPVPLIKTVVAS